MFGFSRGLTTNKAPLLTSALASLCPGTWADEKVGWIHLLARSNRTRRPGEHQLISRAERAWRTCPPPTRELACVVRSIVLRNATRVLHDGKMVWIDSSRARVFRNKKQRLAAAHVPQQQHDRTPTRPHAFHTCTLWSHACLHTACLIIMHARQALHSPRHRGHIPRPVSPLSTPA